MKATITSTGTLVISPENSIEHYALRKWLENYRKEGSIDNASSLMIDINGNDDLIQSKEEHQ